MIVEMKVAYCISMVTLFLVGMWCLLGLHLKAGVETIASRRGLTYQMEKFLDELRDKSDDPMFQRIGMNLSLRKYNAIRKLILLIIITLAVCHALKGSLMIGVKLLLFGMAVYLVLSPRKTFGREKSLFVRFFDHFATRRAHALDEELTGIILQMKNIILSKKSGTSADYILTRLLPFSNLSKAAFQTALSYVRQGRMQEAGTGFSERFGTPLGTSFARIIVKLDELPPQEFLKQLTIVQNNALEEHSTREEKKLVHIQHMKLMLAFSEAILIMGNFVYLILIDALKSMSCLGGI